MKQNFTEVPQTVWTHLGVLTVGARACPAISLLFTVHFMPLEIVDMDFDWARKVWVAGCACRD